MPEWKFNEVLAQAGNDIAKVIEANRFAKRQKLQEFESDMALQADKRKELADEFAQGLQKKKHQKSDRENLNIIEGLVDKTDTLPSLLGVDVNVPQDDGGLTDTLDIPGLGFDEVQADDTTNIPIRGLDPKGLNMPAGKSKAEAFVGLSPEAQKRYLQLQKAKEMFAKPERKVKYDYNAIPGKVAIRDKETNEIIETEDNPFYVVDYESITKNTINRNGKEISQRIGHNTVTGKDEVISEVVLDNHSDEEIEHNIPELVTGVNKMHNTLDEIDQEADNARMMIAEMASSDEILYFGDKSKRLKYERIADEENIKQNKLNAIYNAAKMLPDEIKDDFFESVQYDKTLYNKGISVNGEFRKATKEMIREKNSKSLKEDYIENGLTEEGMVDDLLYEIMKAYNEIAWGLEPKWEN